MDCVSLGCLLILLALEWHFLLPFHTRLYLVSWLSFLSEGSVVQLKDNGLKYPK